MNVSFSTIRLIKTELSVDKLTDDVTSRLLPDAALPAQSWVKTREPGVFSGEAIIGAFQQIFNNIIEFHILKRDGDALSPNEPLLTFFADAKLTLSLERTLLNFLGHTCGIASVTRQFVDEVGSHKTKILATRKTLPGLREIQLQAVRAGGGTVHRRNLSDGILIKDNHLAFSSEIEILAQAAKQRSPLHGIEIEVQSLEQLEQVLTSPDLPDVIMLDNLPVEAMKKALHLIDRRCRVEVSGGVRLEQVKELAALGVDYISVGRLTHTVTSLDLTLDTELKKK